LPEYDRLLAQISQDPRRDVSLHPCDQYSKCSSFVRLDVAVCEAPVSAAGRQVTRSAAWDSWFAVSRVVGVDFEFTRRVEVRRPSAARDQNPISA